MKEISLLSSLIMMHCAPCLYTDQRTLTASIRLDSVLLKGTSLGQRGQHHVHP